MVLATKLLAEKEKVSSIAGVGDKTASGKEKSFVNSGYW